MTHRGQFAVLKKRIEETGYCSIPLSDGWILNYHEKLPVVYNPHTDVLLLGYVWQIEADRISPDQAVKSISDFQKLKEEEESWCGRYVLIMDKKVYLDASGLFGVFYSNAGISSDLSVLVKELGLERSSWRPNDVMRWYPGPGTPYREIKRILPSQIYDLDTNSLSFRNILADSIPSFQNEEELIESFVSLFCASLRNMQKRFKDRKFLLALTGGYDSRTLLALSLRAGIDFDCYTLEHDYMPLGDIDYPPLLCKLAGKNYQYYRRNQANYSLKREEEYLEHLHWMQMEQDRTFYAYGQYQELAEKYGPIVLLRSGVWEIAQEYDRRAVGEDGDVESVLNYYELAKHSEESGAFEQFFQWTDQHPVAVSAANRYFWEQRCGSWIAESEHGFDIYEDIISLQPVNSRKLITMLLCFPVEERMTKFHQAKITARIVPEFRHVPYGKNEDYTTDKIIKLKKTAAKMVRRIRKIGIRRTINMYLHIAADKRKTKQANEANRPG